MAMVAERDLNPSQSFLPSNPPPPPRAAATTFLAAGLPVVFGRFLGATVRRRGVQEAREEAQGHYGRGMSRRVA